ncbi:MAG: type II toxin-antitoxin system HigB family toxin [Bryobacterales bacterium]|nr:type II toxin-antitoxin system HigB family toxin [Bryobacterales bacterium]
MKVYGESAIAKFAKQHAASRKPLARFLEMVRDAKWPHFPAVKQTFQAADYAPSSGTLIFDIGGHKYRLVARVDFEEQILYVESVMTHEKYDREKL